MVIQRRRRRSAGISACGLASFALMAGCGSAEPIDPVPTEASYSIGGTVSGLLGKGLVIANGDDPLLIEADGAFELSRRLADKASYDVTVVTQPRDPEQTCTVTAGKGTIAGADVSDIAVSCTSDPPPVIPTHALGGTVMGLEGTGLVLQNNGGDDLAVMADGPFSFATAVEEEKGYDVTIATQPMNPAQVCTVTAGAGTMGKADVTSIQVKCAPDPATVDLTNADRCDFLDSSHCLFPWPNDYFTAASTETDTGRRVNLHIDSMPIAASVDLSPVIGAPPGTLVTPGNTPLDPAEWNRNDGFSPGQMVLAHVPGLDLMTTAAAPISDIARSLLSDAPILVIDADTLERHLIWAELDSWASNPDTTALIIRAGMNFKEGHRYIVALRNLKNAAGETIQASAAFRVYRDGAPSTIPAIEARRAQMEDIFARLEKAGVAREDLYLAWDFTVASGRNLSERMIHIRDDAFESLGGAAPSFTVTSVIQNPDANRSRRITGTFTVPNYLNQAGGPSGSKFHYATPDDGLPDRMNGDATLTANFICNIPRAALADGLDPTATVTPGRPSLYGHGQQGNASQVNGGSATGELSNLYNFVFCATDFIGMSSDDDLNILMLMTDFSKMDTLADRLQQGLLNNLFLARLMIHPQGFISDPAFQGPDGTPTIDTSAAYYYGISQGGILGGAVVALSQDIRRGALGVTGMNYSLLLDRAIGFGDLRPVMDLAYTNELDRKLILSAIQMIWDRGETNGYAEHVTNNPLPNTPSHAVLMDVAFGDHQVTHWSAEVEARTIGAFIHAPTIAAGRSEDVEPYYGIPAIPQYPFYGSAMLVWDTGPYDAMTNVGTPPPPVTNTPPMSGKDPHSRPRVQPGMREAISSFLSPTGSLPEVCNSSPCFAN